MKKLAALGTLFCASLMADVNFSYEKFSPPAGLPGVIPGNSGVIVFIVGGQAIKPSVCVDYTTESDSAVRRACVSPRLDATVYPNQAVRINLGTQINDTTVTGISVMIGNVTKAVPDPKADVQY